MWMLIRLALWLSSLGLYFCIQYARKHLTMKALRSLKGFPLHEMIEEFYSFSVLHVSFSAHMKY